MKFEELCDMWLSEYYCEYVKVTTRMKYDSNIRNYIKNSTLGDKEVGSISAEDINGFILSMSRRKSERRKRPLSSGTINDLLVLVQQILEYAIDEGYLQKNPARRFKKFPVKHQEKRRPLSKEEQKAIEEKIYASDDIYLQAIIFCLYTGMRLGEVCALMWSDVDLDKGELYIRKNCRSIKDYSTNKWIISLETPKSDTAARMIPLPKFLADDFMELKAKVEDDGPYVFSWKHGPLPPWNLSYRFEKLLHELQIENVTFHSLRHTFCVRALELGMDLRTLCEIAGHADPCITLEFYGSTSMDQKRKAMEGVEVLYLKDKEN